MNRPLKLVLALALSVAAVGCSTKIPPRLEVRDVGSGRTYETYQPWGKITKGVGYNFTDIETGRRITLTNYELRTLEGEKKVSNESAEARSFKEARARGGVK